MIHRREIVSSLLSAALLVPFKTMAQPSRKVWRVGYLRLALVQPTERRLRRFDKRSLTAVMSMARMSPTSGDGLKERSTDFRHLRPNLSE